MNRTAGILACFLVLGSAANAGPISWLINASAADGTHITGSFTFDATTTTFSGLSLTTSGGTSVPATSSWVFNTNNAPCEANSPGDAGFCAVDALSANLTGAHDVSLFTTLGSVLTNAGGTITVDFVRVGTCSDANCSNLTAPDSLSGSGTFTSSATPEPAIIFLTAGGLLVIFARQKWSANRFQ